MHTNKKIIIIISIIIFLTIIISGCAESTLHKQTKTIEVDGMFETITISNEERPIKLIVSGMDCVVTISRDINLKEVIINGDGNLVRVTSYHTFNQSIDGLNNEIKYYE